MQDFTHVGSFRLARQATQAPAIGRLVELVLALRRGWRLRRTIETLRGLDDRTLDDIGLRRDEIDAIVLGHSRPQRRWKEEA
jgi:uncharacterized protein YjiS (DUF1127 family)